MIELVSRKIGTFTLDATEQENNKSTLRITKNPVESGANVADHAILEPKAITIKGKIVAYEPPTATMFDEVLEMARFNLPIIRPAFKLTKTMAKLKAGISSAKSLIKEAKNTINKGAKILAPFLPGSFMSGVVNSSATNRINELFDKLLEVQRSGEPLEITTGAKSYKNMLITSVELTTQSDLWADVTIILEELFIVETKTAGGLKVITSSGGVNKTTNMGKTQPKRESMLKKISKGF
ncbi:hypothetical protein CUREO_1224 [Campylobacter ureolyticus RIGS 9880]|uniref:Dit-like phage tail protein N-terminal domain-containing protein n=1 Tax=Campylobacter ureolyticus RIGS 9880 TaxID=1032069 RepID=A0AAU8U4B5_9BACT|nr:hypothetical protein [Campylobacter ureolyticus]AKT91068.1 hypothetical protein CUREO_1224 [Campylobacter ureolyticus RIGS 9880]